MCSEHLQQPMAEQNHLTRTLLYNQVLTISCDYWLLYWQWETEWSSVWVANPRDRGADWVAATAQHHKRRPYCTLPAWEGAKFKTPSVVSTKCVLLLHHRKVAKSLSPTIVNWGPTVDSVPVTPDYFLFSRCVLRFCFLDRQRQYISSELAVWGSALEESCPVVSGARALLELCRLERLHVKGLAQGWSRGSSHHLPVTAACLGPTQSSSLSALPLLASIPGPLHRCSTRRPNLAFQNRIR